MTARVDRRVAGGRVFAYPALTFSAPIRCCVDDVASLDHVFARLVDDPPFADAVRSDPASALRAYDLTASDLRRLETFLSDKVDIRSLLGTPPDDEPAA